MDSKLIEIARQEEAERYEKLKRCLFCGTEHTEGGGLGQALDLILDLIREDLIPAEKLLLVIGRELDKRIEKDKNK